MKITYDRWVTLIFCSKPQEEWDWRGGKQNRSKPLVLYDSKPQLAIEVQNVLF